jgi:hypothetical protein
VLVGPERLVSTGTPLSRALLDIILRTDNPQEPEKNATYRRAVVRYEGILSPQLGHLEELVAPFCTGLQASGHIFPSDLVEPLGYRELSQEEVEARLGLVYRQRHEHGVVYSEHEVAALMHPDCIIICDAFPPRPAEGGLVMPALAPDLAAERPPICGSEKPGFAFQLKGLGGPCCRLDLVPIPGDSEQWDKGVPGHAQRVAQEYALEVLQCRFRLVIARGKPQRVALRRAAEAVEGASVTERGLEWGLVKEEYGFHYKPPGGSGRQQPIVNVPHPTALVATSPVQAELAKAYAAAYDAATALAMHMRGAVDDPSRLCMVDAAERLFRREGNWKWGDRTYIQVLVTIREGEKSTKRAVSFDLSLLPGPAEVRLGHFLSCACDPGCSSGLGGVQAHLVVGHGRKALSDPKYIAHLIPHLPVPSPLALLLSEYGASPEVVDRFRSDPHVMGMPRPGWQARPTISTRRAR